ncbi:unnamed protein product [Aphanomyces euteiches]
MLSPKKPKKRLNSALELPSITIFEPVRSTKPTRHHVPLDEVLLPLLPIDPAPSKSPNKPRSPVRPVDKVTTALGFKAAPPRLVIRPLFQERREAQTERENEKQEQQQQPSEDDDDGFDYNAVFHDASGHHQGILETTTGPSPSITAPTPPPPLSPPRTPPAKTSRPSLNPRASSSIDLFASTSNTTLVASIKPQKSFASLGDSSEEHRGRRRSGYDRPIRAPVDQSHVPFLAPKHELATAAKRQSMPSSVSVVSLRRPLQKLLLAESRSIRVLESTPVSGAVTVSLLSSGDIHIHAILLEKPGATESLTLNIPAATAGDLYSIEAVDEYSPPWTKLLVSHLTLNTAMTALLLAPPSCRHSVLAMNHTNNVHVDSIATHNGLALAMTKESANPTTAAAALNLHLTWHEVERMILRMDNLTVAEDHIRELIRQPAWVAMLLHDTPLVELIVERDALLREKSAAVALTSPSSGDESMESNHDQAGYDLAALDDADVFPSEELNRVRFVALSMADIVLKNTILWLQQQEAALLYSRIYVKSRQPPNMSKLDALLAQYQDRAYLHRGMLLLVEDMVDHFVHYECRIELHLAKTTGGFHDFIATRIQSAFRMSMERRKYTLRQRVRHSAAKLIQTLQRGITARRRYVDKKLERERYLYFGFRSSLATQAKLDDPIARLEKRAEVLEARRVTFLMGIVTGAFLFNKPITTTSHLPLDDVVRLLNAHAIVVGCPSNMGDLVRAAAVDAFGRALDVVAVHAVQTALVAVLRTLPDDTFGKPASTLVVEDVPRWLLKATPGLHASNMRQRMAARNARLASGRQSAHLIALHYRMAILRELTFAQCRAQWHQDMMERYGEECTIAQFSMDELVCWGMEKLQETVKVWGWDVDAMFEIFNVCLTHRLGKAAMRHLEVKFDQFAIAMNNRAKRSEIHSLRDEINEETQGFEKLLALRCLNWAMDNHVTPASDLLHVLLHSSAMTTDNLRVALPTVLPVATYLEKVVIATRLLADYADDSYGHGFVLLLWSCLDTAENATLEAGQVLEKLARKATPEEKLSPLGRALELLTGSHLHRLLEFCVKVTPVNERVRDAVRQHMEPYVSDVTEMKLQPHRVCLVMSYIEDGPWRRQWLASRFDRPTMESATDFWIIYERLFGVNDRQDAQQQIT